MISCENRGVLTVHGEGKMSPLRNVNASLNKVSAYNKRHDVEMMESLMGNVVCQQDRTDVILMLI